MIISKRHQFIFVAVPKTGTHAVRQALREHLGPDDMEQVRLFENKAFPIPELAALRHGHLTLDQVKPYLPADEFAAAFKFGFVRNPFDRFVSFCSFMTRKLGIFDQDPHRVMREYLFVNPPHDQIHFQPQHIFFAGSDGELMSNYVGRVEEMQTSYDEACRRIGIPSRRLEIVNSSRRGHYRDYFTEELKEEVARLYARDLELFDYNY